MINSYFLRLATVIALCATHPAVADTTAFINVNVLPMSSETVLTGRTVIVEGDIVAVIGSVDDVRIPENAHAVDGTDRFLMPGLAEMHAHVPDIGSSELERYLNLFVANGVTTMRGMLGRPSHLRLREQLLDGEVTGPRLFTSGPSLNGRSVSGEADARRQVREQAKAGYDFIKIHPGLSDEEFTALAETANEVGIPFAGHVPVAAGVETALRLNMATIDHLDGYFVALLPANSYQSGGYGGFFDVMLAGELQADRIDDIAAATAASGTWIVPTQILVEQLVDATPAADLRIRPEMKFMAADTVERWAGAKERQLAEQGFNAETAALAIALRRDLIRALHEAGAGLLLGSDAPQIFNVPGFSLHRELQVLVSSGLTPFEALQTGTTAVAEFLGTNAGSVAVGRTADLVLLDANPLEDIRNSRRIHGVMLRGRWFSALELEATLEPYVTESP